VETVVRRQLRVKGGEEAGAVAQCDNSAELGTQIERQAGNGYLRCLKGRIDNDLSFDERPSTGKVISHRSANEDALEWFLGVTEALDKEIGFKGLDLASIRTTVKFRNTLHT
jgi:hypothetical protein